MSEAPKDPLAGWPLIVEAPIRWGDMDSYAHVNNTVYFRFFEEVRVLLLARTGLDRSAGDVGGILAETRCRFKAPLSHPDRVRVGGCVTRIEDDRFWMGYLLVSQELGRVAAEGDGLIVAYDYAAGGKAPIPGEIRGRLETLRLPGTPAD